MLATFSIAYTRLRQWGAPGKPITVTLTVPPPASYVTTDPSGVTLTPPATGQPPPWDTATINTTDTTYTQTTITVPSTATTPSMTQTDPVGGPGIGGGPGGGDGGPGGSDPLREWTPYPDAIMATVIHTKFWPKYNDNKFISHADDRVRKQGTATSSLAELALSPPHESTGHPIGSAIESYQGFKTVEVWIRQIHIGIPEDMDLNYACTDYMPGSLIYPGHPYHPNKGDVIVQAWNSDEDNPDGAGTGLWQQLYYERPIEELKVIEWETTGSSEFQLDFYFRAAMNSPFHHRVSSFVHVAWHDSCGPQDPCP